MAARRFVRQVFFVLFAGLGFVLRGLRIGKAPERGPVERVLVIRLDLLGDVLFSGAAVAALKRAYPRARVTMLTLPYTWPLAAMLHDVDEALAVDTNRIRRATSLFAPGTWRDYWKTVRSLRTRRFDLAVSVYGRMGSLWSLLSGAPRTVGFRSEAYPGFLSDPAPGGRYRERVHEVEYARRIAAHAGGAPQAGWSKIAVPKRADRRAQALLAACGVLPKDKLVVIHAGSVNGSAKRWPADRWGFLANQLCQRAGVAVALVGAESDREVAAEVMRHAGSRLGSLVGETDIPTLIAILKRADLVASGDSGPLHLAVALGRPLLALYGPTDPAINGPFEATAPVRLHRRDLPCSPCYSLAATAECPLGDPICMRLLGREEVLASALELLFDNAHSESRAGVRGTGSRPSGSRRDLPRSKDELLVPQQNALKDAERRKGRDQ